MKRFFPALLATLAAALAAPLAHAVNLTSVYTQNFDGMGTAGTAAPADWTIFAYTVGGNTTWASSIPATTVSNAGTANATLAASTAFTTTSATQGFNYALSASTSDRALGLNPTTNQGMALQLTLTNTTGAPLTGIRVGYDTRRLTAGSTANELPGYWLFYSTDGGATWTNVAALNPTIAGPGGIIVPNTTGVTTVPITPITFASPVATSGTILLRWVDDNASQSSPDQIYGLDNVVVATPLTGNSALWFDGVNDYVTMGVAAALTAGGPPSNGFTLECWFFKEGAGVVSSSGSGGVSGVPLFGKGRGESENSNVDCNYFFGINAAGQLVADFEAYPAAGITAGQNYPITGSHPAIVNGAWYHAAVTYDGATSTWRLYLNGAPAGTAAAAPNALPRYDSIQHFGIASAMTSTGAREGAFAGRIDEVRVWNYARSAAEIAAGQYAEIASAPGLVGRYGLNEGTGATAGNSTGVAGAPVGTLTNGPIWSDGPSFTPNVPPTVALTAPVSGSSIIFPAVIELTAEAADSDGTVAKVEFFNGATKLGEDITAPYAFSWTNAAVGSYMLTAVVTDNSGATVTSAPVSVTVAPNPNQAPVIALTGPADGATGVGTMTTLGLSIADPEGDGATVTFYGRKTTPATPGPDFVIGTLPDTQFYSENAGGTRAATFYGQTQWYVDNRNPLNLAFVSHMGDIVEHGDNSGNPSEWVVADTAMKIIENQATTLRAYGIPWGGAPGNHDQSPQGDAGGTTTFYNQYFGTARYAGRPYFGGNFGTNNNNNCQLFSVSGLDFIILHLEYDTRAQSFYQPVLDWADALLKAYPNRRAIVTSHWIVNTGNPASFSTQGQAIYEALKNNPNFFLMLCGHVDGEGRRTDVFQGRSVHSVLQDYQGRTNGGDGWLRYFIFSPANNTITARTYSPKLLSFETDADSQFTLAYDMQSAVTDWIPLGAVNVPPGGTVANLDWTGLEPGGNYEWKASVTDGINTVDTSVRRFSTTAALPPTIALTSPTTGASFAVPASIELTADAADADGAVAKVEFYQGNTKLGEDTTAPYSFTWLGATTGSYAITAVAIDNSGRATLSNVANVTVFNASNALPSIALTAPANNVFLPAGAIELTATASDSDGSIAKVEFFQGTTKLGEDLSAPYAFTWPSAAVGAYALTAVATDNDGGIATSAVVNIAVIPPGGFAGSYAQDFNGMGTATAAPAAWTVIGVFGGSNTTWDNTTGIPVSGASSAATAGTPNATLTVNSNAASATATSNTAGFNFALSGSTTDRALGTSPTTGAGVALQLTLTNITTQAVTAFNIGYDTRRFTAPATANSLPGYRLFYSVDGGANWTNVAALNPALTGVTVNVPNTVGVTTVPPTNVVLSAPWFAGTSLILRWIDDNALETSPDQILGLDNVTINGATFVNAAPPLIALTAPAAGATIAQPAFVEIAANASDPDGTIAKVEFFANGIEIGEATAAPYAMSWSATVATTYAITAKATDNDGYATLSAARNITVTAPPGSSGTLVRGPYLNQANQNSIVVRWRSSLSTVGRVRYGLSPDNLNQFTDEASAKTNHEVKLTGLAPYTRYYYSVGSAVDAITPELVDTTSVRTAAYTIPTPTAADYTFRTSPLPGNATDTRIWVVGDCGRGSATQAGGRDAYYTWMGTRVPDLNLQLGDNAYNAGTDAEYQTGYFLMYPTLFRKMPQWSTLGNHDANNGDTNPATNHPYFDMFTFPTAGEAGGVPSGTEHYYSFDYGNIHFICLDSQASSTTVDNPATPLVNEDGPMAAWLRQDLASTTATWIVAFYHHPSYSKGSHDSDTEGQMVNMRTRFNPIMEEGGVDLVLTGHSHNYERSVLLDGHYGISSTITPAMKLNAGNGSTTGFTTNASGIIRNAESNFTAVATVNNKVIAPDGAYMKPLTGPRDHFGAVYNTAGMSGQADGGSLNHSAMYISYNTVGTVNIDVSGNTLVATYIQANGTQPDNYTIIKQGAADSDGDRLPDEWEIANGTNRKNAADAGLDLDGDGLVNRLEYALGTPANVPTRAGLPVLGFGTGADAGKLTLAFTRARAELTYTVQASDTLVMWTDLATNPGSVGALVTVIDANTASPNRYLRLRVSDGVNVSTTVPVGRITYPFPQNQETPVSFPLHDVIGAIGGQPAGFITAVGAATLDNASAGWTPGQLSQAAAPYLLRITSGPAAGRTFPIDAATANTATRLTLATGGVDLTTLGLVAGTTTYELIPADTLATLFPTGTLLSGSVTTGDTLRLWDGTAWITFFHDGTAWQRQGGGVADATLVSPDQGWMLRRRGPAKTVVLYGQAPSTSAVVPITRGASSYVSLLPVQQTFAEFQLQTKLPGWASNAASVTTGDYVAIWNGSLWLNYIYDGAKWVRQGVPTDAGATVLLKPGRPIFIHRAAAGPGSDLLLQTKTY